MIDISTRIIYIDHWLIAIDKPPAFSSVPNNKKLDNCLDNLKKHFPEVKIIHRLDYDTQGLLIFARGPLAQRLMSQLFANRQINKQYLASCQQSHHEKCGILCHHLQRLDRIKYQTQKTGKAAITLYKQHSFNNQKLFYLWPITGRTHQLRVQLQAIGCPIIGDQLYNYKSTNTQTLQLKAVQVQFNHPVSKKPISLDLEHFFTKKQDCFNYKPLI